MRNQITFFGIIAALFFLSSCSMTKMRYSSGWNISFLERGKDVAKTTKIKTKDRKQINRDVETAATAEKPGSIMAPEATELSSQGTMPLTESNLSASAPFISKKSALKQKIRQSIHKNAAFITSPSASAPLEKKVANKTHGDGGGYGLAGFILALLAILAAFAGPIGLIVWLLGLIFSCIGLGGGRSNKGLAIAGLIISLIPLIIVLAII